MAQVTQYIIVENTDEDYALIVEYSDNTERVLRSFNTYSHARIYIDNNLDPHLVQSYVSQDTLEYYNATH